jgi:single-stranded-DNA-specific exonuclease
VKIRLLSEPDKRLNPKVQCCLNRGIPVEDVPEYLSESEDHIYPYDAFPIDKMKQMAAILLQTISASEEAWMPIDSDCDGYSSGALFINYLYKIFPTWVESCLHWSLQPKKGHGLAPFINELEEKQYPLIICIDSATNDHQEIERLHNVGSQVLIFDHHLSENGFSPYAITLNSQYDNYPNSELCGCGVIYKFCKYLDSLIDVSYADDFLDLVAFGLQSDMMAATSLETKQLIFKGFRKDNIKNPLLYSIRQKNDYSISKDDYKVSDKNNLDISPMACSFFITPLVNACCRSGTMEEKDIIFKAFLNHWAFREIPSTKRGHKIGEQEQIVTQATRQLTNIKNRQTRAEDAILEILEQKVKDQNMLDNKVLVFVLKPGEAEPNVRGLAANKMMARYQRPVAVVTEGLDNYAGSMRGYTATGIESFKEVAEKSSSCEKVLGHGNAAGIFLSNPDQFVQDMNEELKDISTDVVYYVDYIFDADSIDGEVILDLAEMNDYIGTGFSRPQLFIKNCEINSYSIMKEKHLKINLPTCTAILWNVDENLKLKLESGNKITINFVAKPNVNEFNWQRIPQLVIIDYEIIEEKEPDTISSWGF